MLGILIGIAAVMLTVGLGQGAQAQVRDQIGKLGSNLLIVSPGSTTSSTGLRGGRGSASTLTARDAAALADRRVAPDIARVAPVTSGSQSLDRRHHQLDHHGRRHDARLAAGAGPDGGPGTVLHRRNELAERRPGRGARADDRAPSCSARRSPVGQTVDVNGSSLTRDRRAGHGRLLDHVRRGRPGRRAADHVRQPGCRPRARTGGLHALPAGDVQGHPLRGVPGGARGAARPRTGSTADAADFTISSQQSLLATATSTDRTLTVLLAGIAAISLLVGGIGVMNIMLVSVTERIREIGLRKALGATPRAVRRQFLVEASMLGFAGGVLGLVLGVAGALVLPRFLGQPVTVSPVVAVGCARRRPRDRHRGRRLPRRPRRAARPHRRPAQRVTP